MNLNNTTICFILLFPLPTATSFVLIAFAATIMTSTGQINYAKHPINGGFEFRNVPAPQPPFYNHIQNNGLPPPNALPNSQNYQSNTDTGSIYFPMDSSNQQSQPRPAAPYNPTSEYQPQQAMINTANFDNNRASVEPIYDEQIVVNSVPPTMAFHGNEDQPSERITEFSWNIFKVRIGEV